MNRFTIITIATPENRDVASTLHALGSTVRDVPFQSLILDNAAHVRATDADGRSFPSTLLVSGAPAATGPLLNAALEHARGEVVVFLPAGARPEPGWSRGIAAMMDRPEVGAVAARIVDAEGQRIRACGATLAGGRFGSLFDGLPRDAVPPLQPRLLEMAWLAGLSVRRSLLEAAGRLDAELGDAFADVDLTLRLRTRSGTIVYRPDVTIRYDGPLAVDRPRTVAAAERFTARWNHIFAPPLEPQRLAS